MSTIRSNLTRIRESCNRHTIKQLLILLIDSRRESDHAVELGLNDLREIQHVIRIEGIEGRIAQHLTHLT